MNLSELTKSDFLAANDYKAGSIWPALTITKIDQHKAPQGKDGQKKATIHLEKAPKPWMCSSNEVLRELGRVLGETNVETAWVGAKVAIKIVGDVRRPDGTKGNAFRIAKIYPKEKGGAE